MKNGRTKFGSVKIKTPVVLRRPAFLVSQLTTEGNRIVWKRPKKVKRLYHDF